MPAYQLAPGEKPKHLYQLKGRRRVFVREVEFTPLSLNSGDVFVLDPGSDKRVVYQWNGSKANRIEKGTGLDFAKKIKDKEHNGASTIVTVDEREQASVPGFWQAFGCVTQSSTTFSLCLSLSHSHSHNLVFGVIDSVHQLPLPQSQLEEMIKKLNERFVRYI